MWGWFRNLVNPSLRDAPASLTKRFMITNQWRKRDAGIGMIAPTVVRTLTCEVEMASLIHPLSSGLRPDGYPTRADREPRAEDVVLSVSPAKPCTSGSVLKRDANQRVGIGFGHTVAVGYVQRLRRCFPCVPDAAAPMWPSSFFVKFRK